MRSPGALSMIPDRRIALGETERLWAQDRGVAAICLAARPALIDAIKRRQ
jgi:hypothetical protein